MNLSQLKTGEEAYIREITGTGAIKQRINEMGFIPGKRVKAIKSAPLKDPVEFDIMGYKLTIRQKDAALIKVDRDKTELKSADYQFLSEKTKNGKERISAEKARSGNKTINVALVGNPNCGKTTIFNFATHSKERVANYSGVTVAAKEARVKFEGYTINLIDLPGTYSLKPYSPEEIFVIDYLTHHTPDLVINVLDAGNIERNLFLTTQLIDLQIRTIVALNMYDELTASKGKLDYEKLGNMVGIPFVPTVGTKGTGLKELFKKVIEVAEQPEEETKNVRVWQGKDIDEAVDSIIEKITDVGLPKSFQNRFVAMQLLCDDEYVHASVPDYAKIEIKKLCKKKRAFIESLYNQDINSEIVSQRYGFIDGGLVETYKPSVKIGESITHKIDQVLTNKYVGIPVFFAIIWFIFFCTFKIGEYPMNWIDGGMAALAHGVGNAMSDGILKSFLVEGIIGGIGGVIVFLPNILILFILISLLEDSGYMARTAFLMDKVMHKVGLHGKSFIPLLMGFGCNVPAIMATRTIESKRDRIVTMFITPFMSCSARLPVYVLFISAFFPYQQSLILFSIYAIGIVAALLAAIILNKTIFKKESAPFVMELPPYRVPTVKAVSKHAWFKTNHFLKKMGTVILLASLIVWSLGYFPRDKEIIANYESQIENIQATTTAEAGTNVQAEEKIAELETQMQSELLQQSYISRIGKTLEPVFAPLGFDWRMSVSVLTGVLAKEVVVSSMGVLYQAGTEVDESSVTLVNKLRNEKERSGRPLIAYFSFLVYVLLYFPCLGTLIAIRKETSQLKWTLFTAAYPLAFAWIVSFLIYQIGTMI